MTADDVAARLGEDFLARVYGTTFHVFRGSGGFPGLLDWAGLDTLLATHRLRSPRLRLSRDGEAVPENRYTTVRTGRAGSVWPRLSTAAVRRELAAGATLVMDAVDELHPPVGELAESLERRLRTRVQVNLYASWNATEGYGVHWDDHDVVVCQVEGRKRWRVHGPTRLAPLQRDVEMPAPPPAEPIAEFVLEAGDVLYLPRGWWHTASASEGAPSLHLTCGLTAVTGVDLLAWVSATLQQSPTVRTDLPRFASPAERAHHLAALRKEVLAELEAPDLLDRFFAAQDAAAPGRLGPSLPYVDGVPADPAVRVRLLTPRAVLDQDDDAGTVTLGAGGQEWTFAAAAGPMLAPLVAGRTLTLAELAGLAGVPVDRAARIVGELVSHEVAAALPPEPAR
jgi:hypothetical protein